MKLGQIALRLRTKNLPDFGNRVFGTVEFALAQEYTVKEETAFVIPLVEADRGDNQYETTVNQVVAERFAVVVALKNDAAVTEKLGLGAFDRLWAVRQKLFCTFLGWIPPDTEKPMDYKGGRLLDINPAWLWYQFEFQQTTRITDSKDGVNAAGCYVTVLDDFLRVYTQWLTGDATQAILPMTGPPPQLPETLVPPDMNTVIDFKPGFSAGFSKDFDTLGAETLT